MNFLALVSQVSTKLLESRNFTDKHEFFSCVLINLLPLPILDALDKAAHTQDKNGGGGVTVNGNLNHLENGGLRRVESGRNMRGSKIPLRTPNVTLDETTSRDFSADFTHNEMESNTSKEDLRRKLGADVYDPDEEDAKRNVSTPVIC